MTNSTSTTHRPDSEHGTDPLDSGQAADAARRGQVNTSAAQVYEDFFVPALFGQFTGAVLDHAGVADDHRASGTPSVLDVGCGTGILARAARGRVGSNAVVAGVDPNTGMLEAARQVDPSVNWRRGMAEALPFPDGEFDHVVCQFAAMFFDDRSGAVSEMARVAGVGTVTLATWSGLHRTPGYSAMVDLIDDELGREAADALRAPFVLGELEDLRHLLAPIDQEARVDEVAGTARFPSIADWVHIDVRGWTLSDLVDDAGESRLARRAEQELGAFVQADGSVSFPAPAIIATADPNG